MDNAPSVNDSFRQAIREWAMEGFYLISNEVKENLTGRVLKVQSGRLRNSIDINSRVKADGFIIGTNVKYGVAWEMGSKETPGFIKAHIIRPIRRKALTIGVGRYGKGTSLGTAGAVSRAGGNIRKTYRFKKGVQYLGKKGQDTVIFRKWAHIPQQAIRPFIRPAVLQNKDKLVQILQQKIAVAIHQSVPGRTFTIEVA